MTSGEIIKILREREGLSQTGLAKLLGLSRSAVSMWESGERVPSGRPEVRIPLGTPPRDRWYHAISAVFVCPVNAPISRFIPCFVPFFLEIKKPPFRVAPVWWFDLFCFSPRKQGWIRERERKRSLFCFLTQKKRPPRRMTAQFVL